MRTVFSAAVVFALSGGILTINAAVAPDAKAPAPQAETKAPADPRAASFDKAADYSTKFAGRAVLIMHKGETIYERYDNGWGADRPHPLASGTKSFTGVAAMFAVQEGLITLDEKVADTLTEWKADPQKSQITVRHLLTLSSGLTPDNDPDKFKGGGKGGFEGVMQRTRRDDWYTDAINAPMVGKPGAQFQYGGNHYYAFGAFLERKLKAAGLTYKSVWEYYEAKIFDPIGMKGHIGRDKAGHPNLPGGAMLTARQWAKFGQLVLQKGSWKQPDGSMKSLLKPELLAECFKPSANNPSYGLTWWLLKSGDTTADVADNAGKEGLAERLKRRNLDEQTKPILGPDGKPLVVHMAAGLGKQRLYILPQLDLVIVRFAEYTPSGARFDNAEFLKPIVEALAK